MIIWQVQLEGDARDLEFLTKIFDTGPRKVLRDERGSGYLYESDSFHLCSNSDEVQKVAEGELAVLSGILKLERDARDSLKYGAVYRLNPNGGRDIFVRVCESIQARVEIGAVSVTLTDAAGNVIPKPPPPPPRSAVLLKLSTGDAAVAKVLRLLSAPDVVTWVGLYRIHEVIEGDVGGQHQLAKQGWGSPDDLRRFRHSANSVEVGGDQSRHENEQHVPPKNPMTLAEAEAEAEAYAKYILQSWLTSKGA